ncbi:MULTISPECIES: phosphate acetyltransferase [unclassified Moraxella]|uniref:phosphate acetyltransferase n=1 Tax=unclassified Moraxella TaxID=2685852 RepID=UPI003AF68134
MQTILFVPTSSGVGLTSACLGFIRALDYVGLKAGFLKPFSQTISTTDLNNSAEATDLADSSSTLAQHAFNLTPPTSISRTRLERVIGNDQLDDLMEEVVAKHQTLTDQYDVIVCEGLVSDNDSSYAEAVNLAIANALDAKVILVSGGDLTQPNALADKLDLFARDFGGMANDRTLGTILMRIKDVPNAYATEPVAPGQAKIALSSDQLHAIKAHSPDFDTDKFRLIGVVPFSNTLSVPRPWDIAQELGATWLNEGEAKTRRVVGTKLVARTVANLEDSFTRGNLLVTAGDRDDLILATALATMNGVPLAGLVLTGGIMPNQNVINLCRPALKTGIPVMLVNTDSFDTVQQLSNISHEIPADDTDRADEVTNYVAAHLDLDWIKATFSQGNANPRLSPSAFRHQLVKKAQHAKQRIVLPEGNEPRTVEAAIICQSRGIANCVLLAKPEEVKEVAENLGLRLPKDLEILDPTPLIDNYVKPMVERRKGKIDELQAKEQLKDTVVLGTMMLYLDEVDGLVSGAVHTTANTVRPAFQLIKTAPQYSLVSSVFFMLLPEQVVVYGDCAINPDPTAEQLAEIALQSAQSAKAFGIEPKVAMISYSTGSSGEGADVDKVRQATEIAKAKATEMQLDVLIDGPLQYDAASVMSVAKSKAPNSPVAGQANVFIFPDLNTGNTTYKAVQRSANVVSVGPMLQGLNKPVNDLSRGALVDDIVYTIALTAVQADSGDF